MHRRRAAARNNSEVVTREGWRLGPTWLRQLVARGAWAASTMFARLRGVGSDSPPLDREGVVHLLGRNYRAVDSEDGSNGWLDLVKDARSRLWFTYKRDFEAIQEELTSDAGWGCMLRSGQMMLAQALVMHYLGRDWIYEPPPKRHAPMYAQIVRWFLDYNDPRICPFSIHSLLREGLDLGRSLGEWYGPHETCVMIKRCVDQCELKSIAVVLSEDGTLFKSDLFQAGHAHSTSDWTPLVVLIPIRLGLGSTIHPSYISPLCRLFELKSSIGVIGGRPKSSLYFIGCQGTVLIFLDPHLVQPSTGLTHDYSADSSSFHCSTIQCIDSSKIDPSVAIGFYIADEEELECFWEHAEKISMGDMPLFSVACDRKIWRADDYKSLTASVGSPSSARDDDQDLLQGNDLDEFVLL